ncbi:bifunctional phosphopantothenoylcysteine decarboxylase/phosphopantothenate--cysteine ligase CoaBC [Campylobacter sp. RM16188]|uniref:bifunctional phosphopantothenoylcysteine decarboxylase/phosphopantothenate--cysteine ligase CoaBC n=1 Tax=Campylobacter sp. RM16188 TaxID=1705725 RepID=UPI0015535FEA|nr:bifunctional phosphopantothenoylcysteine decarboxylase/phosphopantothenate--cysteine ligase CoaBC [Campylobacter sp. RM16188]
MLKNKKILLAVCGSIAFYKAYEILSILKKEGADVYVMLSDGALKFCSALGFEALSEHQILTSASENWQAGLNHIAYAKMDLILIAPASVNTINKLANGICDNVFMQTLIASTAPILIAPAANDKMINHFSTQKSFEFLRQSGVKFIDPVYKMLACKDMGKGALADNQTIIYEVKKAISEAKFSGQKVVISGGATTENIDEVRTITNLSSGKMARALADAFYYAGADVTLIASFECENTPYKTLKFKSSNELKNTLKDELKDANLLVMAAAVSDYIPQISAKGKLKKEDLGEIWQLNLKQNIDILASLNKFKNVKKIGFKMETEAKTAKSKAKQMLLDKKLDAVCLNLLDQNVKFGSDVSEVTFITKKSERIIPLDSKQNIALSIVNLASEL